MREYPLHPAPLRCAGKDASQVRALEVACGTGRFATFLKDNYPGLDLTLSDLSPFYLAEARSNMRYWKAQRAGQLALPGVDRNGTAFLQTAAEGIAAPDGSFDLVYSIYLFHELPPEVRAWQLARTSVYCCVVAGVLSNMWCRISVGGAARTGHHERHACAVFARLQVRRQAAREMARVVKPGGMVVLTDSQQLGDRPCFNDTMGNFGDFNEPYYRSYIAEDLGALFQEAGLECGMKVVGSTTKTLSFRKPHAGEAGEVPPGIAAAAAGSTRSVGERNLN